MFLPDDQEAAPAVGFKDEKRLASLEGLVNMKTEVESKTWRQIAARIAKGKRADGEHAVPPRSGDSASPGRNVTGRDPELGQCFG